MKEVALLSVLFALLITTSSQAALIECETESQYNEQGERIEYVICDDGNSYVNAQSGSGGIKLYAGSANRKEEQAPYVHRLRIPN